METTWSDILNILKSTETVNSALSGSVNSGTHSSLVQPETLELRLIRLQANPVIDEISLAAQCVKRLMDLINEVDYSKAYCCCLIRMGRLTELAGSYADAILFFNAALEVAEYAGYWKLNAIALMESGELARKQGRLDAAEAYQKLAIEIGKNQDFNRECADALNNLANVMIEMGNLEHAEQLLNESLTLAEHMNETRLEGHIYNNLGVVFCIRGSFNSAISEFMRALPKRDQSNDELGLAETYHNLGLAYMDLGNYTRAMQYTEKALETAQRLKNHSQELNVMTTRTELIYMADDLDYALTMAEQLALKQDQVGDRPGMAEVTTLKGKILLGKGLIEKAENSLKHALNIFESLGMIPGQADALKFLGLCLIKKGIPDKARDILQKSKELFTSLGNPDECARVDSIIQGLPLN